MPYEKPLPKPNADTRPFWDGCKKHELRFQKCRDCGHVRWPASVICPMCYSSVTDWMVASGKGRVYTYAVFHQAFHEAFAKDLPYVTAAVELDEGPRLMTNIVGCNLEEVRCDMPVEVAWEDVTEEFSLPKFRPSR
ncbi:MAG: Zn-ribbon domain-containing OB-fold protein [Chloroflexota bacterium]